MSKGNQKFLEAHGLEQWWSDDLELNLALHNKKVTLVDKNKSENIIGGARSHPLSIYAMQSRLSSMPKCFRFFNNQVTEFNKLIR
ncbi:hypothetical protein F8388_010482 [Cannabis sativa]|uniref:Uncharacterized protein n=1 Tax=Cannabis sativa TaxID=3483 RepID=A0A7J6GSL6_CANSA|nr:hypothetical protein F8388_010482 [Cannabis sativa]